MNQKLLALYGLKWNPFAPELPIEAIYVPPRIENFCWRIEHAQIREGGFAMIHGDPGTGKSVALRLLADRLGRLPEGTVGAVSHPQSSLVDFYRELGDIFAVPLKPHNRWGGFKSLREVWFAHMKTTRRRPILLVDEAQEMGKAPSLPHVLLRHARAFSKALAMARRGAAFWRGQLETWCRSDLTQREYCATHGLSEKSFYPKNRS